MARARGDSPELADDSIVVRRPGLSSASLSDERVVLDPERGLYHGLNPVASFLWERLAEPIGVAALHAALLAEYDVDAETARADLLAHLAKLQSEGLIEVRNGTAA